MTVINSLAQEVLDNWQVRKHRSQKTAFIQFLQSRIPEAKGEQGGISRSRNIIVGDVDTAKVVFTAHYDTCARLPLPNMLFPENLLLSLLYSLVFVIPAVLVGILVATLVDAMAGFLTFMGVLVLVVVLMMGPIPNPHTVNDNTSGVVTLLELYGQLTPEERGRCCLVFFDNEENGLLGSSVFAGKHRSAMKDKLLVNFDCVSDGDVLRLIANGRARRHYGRALQQALPADEAAKAGKDMALGSDLKVFYPSDQMVFPCSVGCAAFVRHPVLGPYVRRIHTARDTIFDEADVQCMVSFARRLLAELCSGDPAAEEPEPEAKGAKAKRVLTVVAILLVCAAVGGVIGWLLASSMWG